MQPVTSFMLKHAAVLVLVNLVLFWLWFYSPFEVPQLIPGTPINVHGMVLGFTFIWVLIHLCKQIINRYPAINVTKLTLLGTSTCFIAEFVIQLIRSFTDDADRLYYFLLGLSSMTVFSAFLSFFVAYQLIIKNTRRLVFFIIGFMILCRVLLKVCPTMGG